MSPEPLTLLIADDEPLARALMREHASTVPNVVIVGEAASGDELGDGLIALRPDVAVVDVQMPGEDVFEVLARIARMHPPLPAIVFATAFDAYAVRAFEMNAIDYLIKPVAADRFQEALRRARRHRHERPPAALARALQDLGPRPDRLLVPDGRRLVPIAVDTIVWIKAEADYARIHAGGRSYLVTHSLKELEGRLDPERFLRVHRSAIVQVSHITEVRAQGSSRHRVMLSDGTVVIVSRLRAPELKRLML